MDSTKRKIWPNGKKYIHSTCHCSNCANASNLCTICWDQDIDEIAHPDIVCPECPSSYHECCLHDLGAVDVRACNDLGTDFECSDEIHCLQWIGNRNELTSKDRAKLKKQFAGKVDFENAVVSYKGLKWLLSAVSICFNLLSFHFPSVLIAKHIVYSNRNNVTYRRGSFVRMIVEEIDDENVLYGVGKIHRIFLEREQDDNKMLHKGYVLIEWFWKIADDPQLKAAVFPDGGEDQMVLFEEGFGAYIEKQSIVALSGRVHIANSMQSCKSKNKKIQSHWKQREERKNNGHCLGNLDEYYVASYYIDDRQWDSKKKKLKFPQRRRLFNAIHFADDEAEESDHGDDGIDSSTDSNDGVQPNPTDEGSRNSEDQPISKCENAAKHEIIAQNSADSPQIMQNDEVESQHAERSQTEDIFSENDHRSNSKSNDDDESFDDYPVMTDDDILNSFSSLASSNSSDYGFHENESEVRISKFNKNVAQMAAPGFCGISSCSESVDQVSDEVIADEADENGTESIRNQNNESSVNSTKTKYKNPDEIGRDFHRSYAIMNQPKCSRKRSHSAQSVKPRRSSMMKPADSRRKSKRRVSFDENALSSKHRNIQIAQDRFMRNEVDSEGTDLDEEEEDLVVPDTDEVNEREIRSVSRPGGTRGLAVKSTVSRSSRKSSLCSMRCHNQLDCGVQSGSESQSDQATDEEDRKYPDKPFKEAMAEEQRKNEMAMRQSKDDEAKRWELQRIRERDEAAMELKRKNLEKELSDKEIAAFQQRFFDILKKKGPEIRSHSDILGRNV